MLKGQDMNRIGFVIYGNIIVAASLALRDSPFGTDNAQNEPNISFYCSFIAEKIICFL
jgi:hypothetical protein